MSNELVRERRAFLKKRFVSSSVQLWVALGLTLYNCMAELFFPSFVLPFSFYLPQFAFSMAASLSEKKAVFVLCVLGGAVIISLLAASLLLSKRLYKLVGLINVVLSVDMVLLIYIGLQSLFLKGFHPFFVVNLFAHIWLLALTIRLRRASEGLEVLPDGDNE